MHGLIREGWYPATMIRLVRPPQTKGAATDRPGLRLLGACPLLYLEPSRALTLKP